MMCCSNDLRWAAAWCAAHGFGNAEIFKRRWAGRSAAALRLRYAAAGRVGLQIRGCVWQRDTSIEKVVAHARGIREVLLDKLEILPDKADAAAKYAGCELGREPVKVQDENGVEVTQVRVDGPGAW